MAECRRSATMSADVGGDALQRERGGDGPQRGRDDRCATTGETGWSAGRTRFQLTPDSASGDRVEREICTARRCRCRCSAGVRRRRRSAAHMRRCVYPRRCRGLTEGETARAVGSEMHYNGRGGVVRRADPFSVNFYLCTINRKLRETLRIVKKKDRDGELLC